MIKATLRAILHSIEYRRLAHLLRRNEELRNCHAGQKAFLFATGASLVGMDLSQFNGQVTIGCNEIFRHPSFPALRLAYYAIGVPFRRWRQISPRFTHADHHQYFSAINEAFRDRDTVHLYHATLHQYLENRNLLRDISRYYFLRKESLDVAKCQTADLSKPITLADGGLTLMIALAMFMGCTEIYLFGCGYTYTPVQAFHFYNCFRCPARISKNEMEAAMTAFRLSHPETEFRWMDTNIVTLDDDELMVDFSYYPDKAPGSVGHDFYHTHRIVRSFAESKGVKIMNVVPPGYSSKVYESAPSEVIYNWSSGWDRLDAARAAQEHVV